ncbi:beta-N-acetylhexosaminidase [Haliangium ochraceum]|uniref:Glycoside hydrolase family 3 domain protein n=1 Tax=Haliangium ochraceum (strain DSM 14365 / JCM 11303 / SMP-2) TaxID=502025 RepID=D0LSI1_HALO1|nr:beta-N-acetylhexosaminidase [Haliangium ochraceum]ACY15680.1 glycoside hydrolase family 3 domain protein [Haliangium ochraceum DSM 14365]
MQSPSELEIDVGQLLWFGYEGDYPPADMQREIAAGLVGGVLLFKRNLPPEDEHFAPALRAINRRLHQSASGDATPLWIAIDQEGGTVQRVRQPGTVWPPMLSFDALAEARGDQYAIALAERVGLALGHELAALEIDVDFAPVLDVHTNPANPVIGKRALSSDPEQVAQRGLALARGLERAGVVSCGKHFPGHGDTDTDSHLALPRLTHGSARLDAIELLPFARAAAADIPMIMTAHVVFAALDDTVPATLSHAVITGLLRRRLGYQGLIVSDDLDMRAIAAHFGIGEAAVMAVRAGCDVLLLCRDRAHQEEARRALLEAAARDSDIRAAIAAAAARVRAAKRAHGERSRGRERPDLDVLGCADHLALASELAAAGAHAAERDPTERG